MNVLSAVLRGISGTVGGRIPERWRSHFISTNTVATHVARILGKLDATTRTEAVGRVRETGILDL